MTAPARAALPACVSIPRPASGPAAESLRTCPTIDISTFFFAPVLAPVTSALRSGARPDARGEVGDVRAHVADRDQLRGVALVELGVELISQHQHQLHDVERIGAEILDDARGGVEVLDRLAKLLGNHAP